MIWKFKILWQSSVAEEKSKGLRLRVTSPFILFALTLITLTMKFPIKIPVTDDWLYLPQGAREPKQSIWANFELITGHQQVLVKFFVSVVSYLPGNYIQNLTIVNILIASLGLYLIALSQLKDPENKFGKIHVMATLVLLFNLKSMYIYMSATGFGLSLAIFLIGVYFFGKNIGTSKYSRPLVITSLFLCPFTTGLGLVIPMSHLLSVALKVLREKILYRYYLDILIGTSGIFLAYILPTIFHNLNARSGNNSVSDVSSYLSAVLNPFESVLFLFGLIGNPLFPSSRFDPIPQVTIGVLISSIFLLIFVKTKTSVFYKTLIENQNPLLAGIMFFVLIISFRGSKSLSESTAPRYVIGSLLFLFGAYIYALKAHSDKNPKELKKLIFVLTLSMLLSLTGVKTGIEWLTTRSSQSDSLYYCLADRKLVIQECMDAGSVLREEGTNDEDFQRDLRRMRFYIESI